MENGFVALLNSLDDLETGIALDTVEVVFGVSKPVPNDAVPVIAICGRGGF
jgi:hypothetical protein